MPAPRRWARRRPRGRTRRRCWPAGRRWAPNCRGREAARGDSGGTRRHCSWGCPICCTPACPTDATRAANVEVRRWGEPRHSISSRRTMSPSASGMGMDFEAAGRISGARFVVMSGNLARLHRALIQFMLDLHTSAHGYREAYVPYLVHAAALEGTGQLPKFEQDLFAVRGDPGFFLIPTAEVPVTNLVRDQILAAELLPLKYRGAYAVLPVRGGRVRQGHARHDPPASVREGGAGAHRAPRAIVCGARGTDQPRRGGAQGARIALSRHCAVRGRRRVRQREDLRSRGLAAVAAALSGDLILQQLRVLSGAPPAGSVAQSGHRQAGTRAYAERLGSGRRPGAGRDPGELSKRGRLASPCRPLSRPTWRGATMLGP